MFDKDQFIADCRAALDGADSSRNVREVVARAVSDPAAVLAALGEPTAGGIVADPSLAGAHASSTCCGRPTW